MKNQNVSANNNLVDENGNINFSDRSDRSDCSDRSDRSECKERSEGMLFTQELLERHGMLFLSRLQ